MNKLIKELTELIGKEYIITPDMAQYHAYTFGDATLYRSKPDIIVYPFSESEVSGIIKIAGKYKIPVTASGGLTGLSGGAITHKGILLNLLRMNSVKSVDTISKTVVASPGITCADLNKYLKEYGLIVPVAPASHLISTLGANIAEAAGGTWGMSKGTFKNYLLSLRVVDGRGNIFCTGAPLTKQSTGPDITSLFLGSEGTMGVITEITLRCEYLAEDTWTIRCSFPDEEVLQKIHEEIAINHIELYSFEYMDSRLLSCIHEGASNMLLLFQTTGSKNESKAQADKLVEVLKKLKPLELVYTNDPVKADELYTERRSALGALAKADKNKPVIIQFDPVLPLDKLTLGIRKMREIAERENLDLIIYGHAGDGNLHPSFIVPDNIEEKIKARKAIREFDDWVEKEGGCYSGEHAVGFFLGRSQDKIRPQTADYLRKIKEAFDPDNILNPGKVIDIREGSMDISPALKKYSEISKLSSLCVKCHLCKNDSPAYLKEPFEHNTIRGRVAMIDAASRGAVSFSEINPFVEELSLWVKDMNCPSYIKNDIGKLIELAIAEA
ncbi:MAG TPA: FAD-binding oxidoreductase [Actinobacteria bacterium]|nr:FAD-binding oxidoreductase [Actinomycetota bacterium]